MYIEITGEVAAALRRNEIGYDQINDQVVLRRFALNVKAPLPPVQVMVYDASFLEYVDNYKQGFVQCINFLILYGLFLGFSTFMMIKT